MKKLVPTFDEYLNETKDINESSIFSIETSSDGNDEYFHIF